MKKFKTPAGTELPLLQLRGNDYLEVKYRIVWFREVRPTWSIETEFVQTEKDSAFAKATIRDDAGRIMATAHKFEDVKGFGDFREKAETSAIGRALALLGFGTQFCADELDEIDPRKPKDQQRLADSPIARSNPHAAKGMQPEPGDGIQPDEPACQCGEILKYTAKKSEKNPDGSWYCPNFKDISQKHDILSPAEYEQYRHETLMYAHEKAKKHLV